MSWKPEIFTEGKWYPNGLAFSTKEEGEAAAEKTYQNWTAAEDHRAVESNQPVNYRYVDGKLISVDDNEET